MKNRENPLLTIPRLFAHENIPEVNYRQISSFFYDQLIDAFIFFSTSVPVDWNSLTADTSKLKALAEKFKIMEINDALLMQCECKSHDLIGISLGKFFGRQFYINSIAWNNLIQSGQVFSEFTLSKKGG
ncbi:MAG: hypothetical protein EHM20_10810, partial [Alphaproteobacteria bacterium]